MKFATFSDEGYEKRGSTGQENYWHGNPARYELDDRMRKQHRIDDAFREKAEAAGYCVRRVWVSEMASYKGDE